MDQYGNKLQFSKFSNQNFSCPFCAMMTLSDALGEKILGDFTKSENDTAVFDKKISTGSYNVEIATGEVEGEIDRYYSPLKTTITVPKAGSDWNVEIQLNQDHVVYYSRLNITFNIVTELGTPVNPNGDSYLLDGNGKRENLDGGWSGCGSIYSDGLSLCNGLKAGTYTLHIASDSYQSTDVHFSLPDDSRLSDQKIASQRPGNVNLGTIVLKN